MCWFTRYNHLSPGRQLYTSGYLQASLNHMFWLRHTMNLPISDLELLFSHGQLTIMLTEEIGA